MSIASHDSNNGYFILATVFLWFIVVNASDVYRTVFNSHPLHALNQELRILASSIQKNMNICIKMI